MTILPYEGYFSRWQRAKIRAQALVKDFKDWCADGNATLPDWWNPARLERGYSEVPSEMEKVRQDHRDKTMIAETDIYCTADVLIRQHGDGALLEAMNRIEAYRRIGNSNGMDAWRRIANAIETLQIPAHLSTQTCH